MRTPCGPRPPPSRAGRRRAGRLRRLDRLHQGRQRLALDAGRRAPVPGRRPPAATPTSRRPTTARMIALERRAARRHDARAATARSPRIDTPSSARPPRRRRKCRYTAPVDPAISSTRTSPRSSTRLTTGADAARSTASPPLCRRSTRPARGYSGAQMPTAREELRASATTPAGATRRGSTTRRRSRPAHAARDRAARALRPGHGGNGYGNMVMDCDQRRRSRASTGAR